MCACAYVSTCVCKILNLLENRRFSDHIIKVSVERFLWQHEQVFALLWRSLLFFFNLCFNGSATHGRKGALLTLPTPGGIWHVRYDINQRYLAVEAFEAYAEGAARTAPAQAKRVVKALLAHHKQFYNQLSANAPPLIASRWGTWHQSHRCLHPIERILIGCHISTVMG